MIILKFEGIWSLNWFEAKFRKGLDVQINSSTLQIYYSWVIEERDKYKEHIGVPTFFQVTHFYQALAY